MLNFNLSEYQKKIITAPEDKIIVVSSSASGKTTVLTERLQYILSEKKYDPTKIVAITFTNAAAAEIANRVTGANGVFIGTIHSYANHLLKGINIDTSSIIQDERFDEFFSLVKNNLNCIKEVDYLLLDEAQDCTQIQMDFILKYIKPKAYFLIGDWRQSIYRWSGSDPHLLYSLTMNRDVKTYSLKENYRNDKNILQYGKNLIRLAGAQYIDDSICMSNNDGRVVMCEYDPIKIINYIKTQKNYGSWFFLTRTNAQLEKMSIFLKRLEVPFDTFKRSEVDPQDFSKRMSANTVKLLTIHAAKGLEADNVVVLGATMNSIEEICLSYVAATRARHLLIWFKHSTPRTRERVIKWE